MSFSCLFFPEALACAVELIAILIIVFITSFYHWSRMKKNSSRNAKEVNKSCSFLKMKLLKQFEGRRMVPQQLHVIFTSSTFYRQFAVGLVIGLYANRPDPRI